jgi:hypothetical protein
LSAHCVPRIPEHMQRDLDRLEALTSRILNFPVDDEAKAPPRTTTPSLVSTYSAPLQIGSDDNRVPATFAKPPVSDFDQSALVVRVTKGVWDAMGEELGLLKRQKQEIEHELSLLRLDQRTVADVDYDMSMQIAKLRYQNESNNDQKATMSRVIAQKDVETKQQHLETQERDRKILELEAELRASKQTTGEADWLRGAMKDADAAHAKEVEKHSKALQDLEGAIFKLTVERDKAVFAEKHAKSVAASAQELGDALGRRETHIRKLQNELVEEKERNYELEDEVLRLKKQNDPETLNDMKAKLEAKTNKCDRLCNQLKDTEQELVLAKSQLWTAANGGKDLKGGAHLVVPNIKTTLPKNVFPCGECLAGNMACDNKTRCRPCTESGVRCARWRCSLKQKLSECPLTPCLLQHDTQGWLVLGRPRPIW